MFRKKCKDHKWIREEKDKMPNSRRLRWFDKGASSGAPFGAGRWSRRGGIRTLGAALMDLLLPQRCRICSLPLSDGASGLCPACLSRVRYLGKGICACCGTELPGGTTDDLLCGGCLRRPPPFSLARSVARYGTPLAELLHRLKYLGDTRVLPALAVIAAPFDLTPFASCSHIVPVPLHPRRLRQRGLNQSLLLARMLFADHGGRLAPGVVARVKMTRPQTGLGGIERRRNLRGAFKVVDPGALRHRSVCLVDDVYTTGSTVAECSRVLLAAGSAEVRVLTLARAVSS